MTALLLAAFVAAAPLVLDAPGAGRAPSPAPVQDPAAQTYSKDWKRLRSAHFLAAGNADYVSMRRVLVELEGFRRALLRSLPALRVAAAVPTTVVIFKDEASFSRFRPRDDAGRQRDRVAAYLMSGREASYLVVPMHRDPARTFHYVFHEYTHFIVRQNLAHVPEWLNEGLAELYSTFRASPREGHSVLGEAPQNRMPALRSGRFVPIREFLSMDDAARAKASMDVQQMFYAQAWALVHYVMFGEGGRLREGVPAYLKAVSEGAPVEAAWPAAFGMPLEVLEQQMAKYGQRRTFPSLRIDEPAGGVPMRTSLEAMPERDVADLHRELLDLLARAAR